MQPLDSYIRKQTFSFLLTLSLLAGFEAYSQSQLLKVMPFDNPVAQNNPVQRTDAAALSQMQAVTEEMRVYPSHTNSERPVTVQMLALQPLEKFDISIYTLEGRLIKKFEAAADKRGNYVQLIDTSDLSDGSMYMVQATFTDKAFIRHLQVDR